MFKLALNAGHGYETAGKRCLKSIDPKETREYELNRRICDKIAEILGGTDIKIIRIDNGKDIPIRSRAAMANTGDADLYLSIHHNAGIRGGAGGGIEAYVYPNVDAKTLNWQRILYNATVAATGLRGNRAQPLRSADFGELRLTKMPAVLLECGFMDSTTDTPIILGDDFAQKIANAVSEVIIAKSGVKRNDTAKKTNEQLADEVIRGLWGNGAERKKRIADAGYDYAAIQRLVNERLA